MPKFGEIRYIEKYVWWPTELPIGTSSCFSWRWLTYETVIQTYDDKFGVGWRDVAWAYS